MPSGYEKSADRGHLKPGWATLALFLIAVAVLAVAFIAKLA